MYKHIKPEIIEQSMFNNQDMIKEFINLYRAQTPLDFQKLTTAVNEKNHQEISNAAHHIKPTMEYIGALHLKNHLQKLESLATEIKNIAQIQTEFTVLKMQFDELFTELEQYQKLL
jgi:HPt (histidine-containing phosphotransfer) domain-containing protein